MESPVTKALSPSKTPLNTASPERINQQKIVSSPSMPIDGLQTKQSDVQAKIAFLNNLARTGSPTPASQSSASAAAAIQRAVLGREEAESALARANSQLSEAQSRERRISERLESLLEELQSTRERQAHERSLFEKEVRKARKEAFRASSTLVRFQEELKLSKGEIKNLKDEVRAERDAKEKAKQEAFERAYALAGLTEELHTVQEKLKTFETNLQSDALETRARDIQGDNTPKANNEDQDGYPNRSTHRRPKRSMDDVDQAENGSSPTTSLDQAETPPKKIRLSRRASNKENVDPEIIKEETQMLEELRGEIKTERRLRQKAEDMVHFLKMECQFKMCSCRLAERQGTQYVHDSEWEKISKQLVHETPAEEDHQSTNEPLFDLGLEPDTKIKSEPTELADYSDIVQEQSATEQEMPVSFSPSNGTVQVLQLSEPTATPSLIQEEPPLKLSDIMDPETEEPIKEEEAPQQTFLDEAEFDDVAHMAPQEALIAEEVVTEALPVPSTVEASFHTSNELHTPAAPEPAPGNQDAMLKSESISVKTVPLLPEDNPSRNHAAMIPGTPISREEALAQIRARRDRARSAMKRSASASEATARSGGIGVTPLKGTKRGTGRATDTRSEPDLNRSKGR